MSNRKPENDSLMRGTLDEKALLEKMHARFKYASNKQFGNVIN